MDGECESHSDVGVGEDVACSHDVPAVDRPLILIRRRSASGVCPEGARHLGLNESRAADRYGQGRGWRRRKIPQSLCSVRNPVTDVRILARWMARGGGDLLNNGARCPRRVLVLEKSDDGCDMGGRESGSAVAVGGLCVSVAAV